MAITAAPGWMVDPSNPNHVIPAGSASAINNPNAGIIAPQATPTNTSITRTSSAPTPPPVQTSTPAPTYSGVINNSINNTPAGNALVDSNAAQAAKLGISIPNSSSPVNASSVNNVPVSANETSANIPNNIQQNNQNSNIGSTGNPTGGTFFGNTENSLVNTSVNGSPNANTASVGAINVAQNSDAYNSAKANYAQAVNDLNTLKQHVQDQLAAVGLQAGVPLQFVQGQQQVIAQQAAAQLDAAQQKVTEMSNVLNAGIAQEGAQTTAYGTAGNIANTAQAQTQSGLTSAATLSQPTGNYPWSFDPTTGQFKNATSGSSVPTGFTGNFQQDAASMAQKVISHATDWASAESALVAQYGTTGTSALTNAVIAAGGNPNILKAQAEAQALNVKAGATAAVEANKAIYAKAASDYADLKALVTNVDQFGTLLTNGMIDKTTGQTINPINFQGGNATLAAFRSALSDSQQAQFDSTFAALKSKISGLLAIGGAEIPTQITNDSNSILSGTVPLKTLDAVLARIQSEGNTLLQTQADKSNTALQETQGGTNTISSASSSGGFTKGQTSNDGSLMFDGTNWVKNTK